MVCDAWQDEWVASLYDELDEPERERLQVHLAQCPTCVTTLEALRATSRLLRQDAPPVPAAPRVLVLRSRQGSRSAWAFASGVAAALVIFACTVFVVGRPDAVDGASLPAVVGGSPPDTRAHAVPDETQQASEELAALRRRLELLEQGLAMREAHGREAQGRAELQQELEAFFDRYEAQRSADLDYFLETVAASEQRIDRNSQALTYLALRENPRVTEH